jgi:hypothetical protein
MAKLSEYAEYAPSSFESAGAGAYRCALVDVQVAEKKKYVKPGDVDTGEKEPCLRFYFESLEAAQSNGSPYRFLAQVGTAYTGNTQVKNLNLTILVDGMLGLRASMTPAEYELLDINDLMAREYLVIITEYKNKMGEVRDGVSQVKPFQQPMRGGQRQAPAPVAQRQPTPKSVEPEEAFDDNDLEDPFQNEEDAAPTAAYAVAETQQRRGNGLPAGVRR